MKSIRGTTPLEIVKLAPTSTVLFVLSMVAFIYFIGIRIGAPLPDYFNEGSILFQLLFMLSLMVLVITGWILLKTELHLLSRFHKKAPKYSKKTAQDKNNEDYAQGQQDCEEGNDPQKPDSEAYMDGYTDRQKRINI